MKMNKSKLLQVIFVAAKTALCIACVGVTVWALHTVLIINNAEEQANVTGNAEYLVMDRYDRYITNSFSDALDGVLSIKKVYWLSDSDLVAPEPNPACYGEVSNPRDMQVIINQARDLLEGQELVFSTDVVLCPGTVIRYYYDPTILAITWQEVIDGAVYTMSEVKIADDSQFRRFLSDGKYGSGSKYLTSEMAKSVNAVVAVNGDYYAMRQFGTIVYNSQMMRMEGLRMDCCFIDGNGDMHFVERGEITSEAEMEKYLEERAVRFSLAFGPILVEDGKTVKIKNPYCEGEIYAANPRAALCQKDSLHYLMVLVSGPPEYDRLPSLARFAQRIQEMGVDKAYNLDGGRSAILVMNDEQVNYVYERRISDIVYFATAIPGED